MSDFIPEAFFIRNAWTVAAWPAEITGNQPLARTIMGDDLVMFRTADGTPVALEDRCAHRLAPLSLGKIEADGRLPDVIEVDHDRRSGQDHQPTLGTGDDRVEPAAAIGFRATETVVPDDNVFPL